MRYGPAKSYVRKMGAPVYRYILHLGDIHEVTLIYKDESGELHCQYAIGPPDTHGDEAGELPLSLAEPIRQLAAEKQDCWKPAKCSVERAAVGDRWIINSEALLAGADLWAAGATRPN